MQWLALISKHSYSFCDGEITLWILTCRAAAKSEENIGKHGSKLGVTVSSDDRERTARQNEKLAQILKDVKGTKASQDP